MATEKRQRGVYRSTIDPTSSEKRSTRFYAGDLWLNGTTGSLWWLTEDVTGTWVEIPVPSVFVASGASAATGLVPAPSSSAGTSALLREDATWVEFATFVNSTASTAITGTTETEATFDTTVTIPADFFVADDLIEIYAQGIHTAQSGTETLAYFLKAGSTTICNTGNIDPPAAPCPFRVEFRGVFRSIGASADLIGGGFIEAFQRASSSGSAHRIYTGSSSTSHTDIDTTGSLAFGIAIDRQASATDADSARLDFIVVRVRRKMMAT